MKNKTPKTKFISVRYELHNHKTNKWDKKNVIVKLSK